MTSEEKQLLLEDLSARLPYGVYVHIRYNTGEPCYGKLTSRDIQWFVDLKIESVKPYLRPLYSMTKEELEEFRAFHCVHDLHPYFYPMMCNMPNLTNMFNWLNKHHIDYRGLIPKGLALEAPDRMYNIK